MFCKGINKGESMAFNKQISEERFVEIKELIRGDILEDLKLELNEKEWSNEWKKVTKEQWVRILEIPEADKEVIESIIGFELELNGEEMTMEEVCKELGRTIKIKK